MFLIIKNYINLIVITFGILIFVMLSNFLHANISIDKINSYNSSTTKLLLTTSWNLKIINSEESKNITIPFFVKDKNHNDVIFYKNFSIPQDPKYTKARLWILGLHGNGLIYLNGILIKKHLNSPTTFSIDLNVKSLKKENNLLEIRLSNLDENGDTFDFRYPNYPKQFRPIGISREIYLELFPEKYLDNIEIRYKENKLNLIYELNITDSSKTKNDKTVKIEEEIISPDGLTIHKRFEYVKNKPLKKQYSRILNIKSPIKWNYDSPKLYNIKLSINSSSHNYYYYVEKMGFRTIETKKSKFLINNKVVELKGVNYRFNFENGTGYIDQAINDLNLIKEIGFNSIRFVNYIPHPAIAKYADSLGVLLFIDAGFWRMPLKLYTKNKIFNKGKQTISETAKTFSTNASVIGLGIGNEPNINFSQVRKYAIVLKKYLNDNFNFLTYISPLNYSVKVEDNICDFVMLQNYNNPDVLFSFNTNKLISNTPVVFGNIYYPVNQNTMNEKNKMEINRLQQFYLHYDSLNIYNGYFVESYNDWIGEVPNFYTEFDKFNNVIYPFGLVDLKRVKKEKFDFFASYFKDIPIEVSYYKADTKNNFHSIVVFIMAIIFFLIYKRNYRLKENLIRSIQHPYGFFVDLRDRRIISVFNSTLMGITIGTIISSFVSSIIYANNNSLLFDEYINIFISDINLKIIYLSVFNSPWKLFLFILILISILQIIFALLVKILGLFSKEKRKFRQIYSIISWSGSHFLFFVPVCLFAYNFTINNILYPEMVWVFILFLLWYNFRMVNGFRILFLIQPLKMAALVFLTYLILIISLLGYINMDIDVFDYFKSLSAAHNLY